MRLIIRLVFIAAVVAAGIWLWTVLFPSPATVIQRQLNRLAAKVSFAQNEGNLTKLARVENIADFFTSNVTVNIDVPGYDQHALAGRDEITQAALGTRQAVKWLSVKFPDINVTVAPNKKSAVADLTVEVSTPSASDAVVQEAKIYFERSNGEWLINQVETVRTVSEPPLQ